MDLPGGCRTILLCIVTVIAFVGIVTLVPTAVSHASPASLHRLKTVPGVILSLTTTPARLLNIPRVAAMWDLRVSESLSVSRIIAHVPPKLERTGEPYPKDVVGEWRKVYGPTFDPRVVVNYVDEDAGPLTKWIGVGTVELHPTTWFWS